MLESARASIEQAFTTSWIATTGALALTLNDANPDTITRAAGSFVDDGFKPGQLITVTGTAANDGTYTLASVLPLTLTLIGLDALTQEGPVVATITAPLTPVAWPNHPFSPPSGASGAWVEPRINWGDGFVESKEPTRLNSVTGVVSLRVFVPAGEGDGELYKLLDVGRSIFRRVDISEVEFLVPSGAQLIELDEGDKWREAVIVCPFNIQEEG